MQSRFKPKEAIGDGAYELIECIGIGGFGEVWKARHRDWNEIRAVKLPTDPAYVRFLRAEGRFLYKLDHPNIVKVFELNTQSEQPYMAMEYIQSRNLRQVLQNGPLPWRLTLQIAEQVLEALKFAHSVNLIHCDIKPENILLTPDNRVKVTDFGLGQVTTKATRSMVQSFDLQTLAGVSVAGTYDYMSPEQKTGLEIDGRSDLYSLGIVLLELMTGTRESRNIAYSLRKRGVPMFVHPLIDKALLELEDRYQSAADMLADVTSMLQNPPLEPLKPAPEVVAPAPGVREPRHESPRPPRPPKKLVCSKTAILALLVAAAIIAGVLASRPKPPGPDPTPRQPTVQVGVAAPATILAVIPSTTSTQTVESTCTASPTSSPTAQAARTATRTPTKIPTATRTADKVPTPAPTAPSRAFVAYTNTVNMKMIPIRVKSFVMGSPEGVGYSDEHPEHTVTLTQDFYLADAEVTNAQFAKFTKENNYKNEASTEPADHPVVNVSWHDAVRFCNWLSEKEKRTKCYTGSGDSITCDFQADGYRLPTEAEWEYACRAGTTAKFSFGNDEAELHKYGNYDGTGDGYEETAPVRSFEPNPWKLYDMHGNVWEWCWDWYDGEAYQRYARDGYQPPPTGSLRVYRGGSWNDDAQSCRAAYRGYDSPTNRLDYRGFRLARSLP